MGRCIYCGRPAGFLRRMHPQCKTQHDYALARIPEFFPRFFDSDLPADRFCQLLQEGANASYVKLPELRDAVARGISTVIDRDLHEHLLNEAETKRFADVADALAPILNGNDRVYEKLAKIDVLSQLDAGQVPDVVSVQDELPIALQPEESVIWIFNDVTSYRRKDRGSRQDDSGMQLILDSGTYYKPNAFQGVALPVKELNDLGQNDLIVTNRNLFYVRERVMPGRISLANVTAVHAYAGAVRVTSAGVGRERSRTFRLDDVWFAANLMIRLCHLARIHPGTSQTAQRPQLDEDPSLDTRE